MIRRAAVRPPLLVQMIESQARELLRQHRRRPPDVAAALQPLAMQRLDDDGRAIEMRGEHAERRLDGPRQRRGDDEIVALALEVVAARLDLRAPKIGQWRVEMQAILAEGRVVGIPGRLAVADQMDRSCHAIDVPSEVCLVHTRCGTAAPTSL